MPKYEPDVTDPMELVGVDGGGGGGESTSFMAECLAEEFLRMGHGVQDVMTLFRSPEFALAHRAWSELGEVRVFALVSERAQFLAAMRRARGGHHA